jgi:hypothetical protein
MTLVPLFRKTEASLKPLAGRADELQISSNLASFLAAPNAIGTCRPRSRAFVAVEHSAEQRS